MRLLAAHSHAFDPATPWVELGHQTVSRSPLFHMLTVRRRSPHTGREYDFTRLECPAWVNVIAVTQAGEILAVEQFRHGSNRPSLEIIGGVCDPGEEPHLTARRELLEETGHVSDRWVSLGSCAPNPAIQDNRCHFFLALDCRSEGALDLDPSEELRVWAFSWQAWETLLQRGDVDHALVMSAFLRLFLWDGWTELKRCLA